MSGCGRLHRSSIKRYSKVLSIYLTSLVKSHACFLCDLNCRIVYLARLIQFSLGQRSQQDDSKISFLLSCFVHLLWLAQCYLLSRFLYYTEKLDLVKFEEKYPSWSEKLIILLLFFKIYTLALASIKFCYNKQ